MSSLETRDDSDASALGDTLRALRPRMTSVALRFAPDRDAAEDIVQNAYEKAVRHHHRFRGQSRLSTWLHRIVVNESLMWLRSERRRGRRQVRLDLDLEGLDVPDRIESAPDPAEQLARRELQGRLHRGLARLPDEERDVIVQCALEEWTYEHFSAVRGLQPAAAKSRAFRGRQKLRALLAEP